MTGVQVMFHISSGVFFERPGGPSSRGSVQSFVSCGMGWLGYLEVPYLRYLPQRKKGRG